MHTGGNMAYRYFLKLEFNGEAYGGWQIQPNARTVQQLIENGLKFHSGQHPGVTGCGRTDAGVHGVNYYAHFDHSEPLTETSLIDLTYRLNRFLPIDIYVQKIIPVLPGAHARYSALWREYEYDIIRRKDPFRHHRAYFVHGNLDVAAMEKCTELLLGRHNYECFSKVHTQVNNFFCEVMSAKWEEDEHVLKFTIRADRFLRNMVRAIVGTMLDVGRGKISSEEFKAIIDSRNRSLAGYSVPAKGLALTGIGYPEEIFTNEPVFFLPESDRKIISHYYTDPGLQKPSGEESN